MIEAFGRVAEELGGLDVVVNNAGGGRDDEDLRGVRRVPPFTNLDQERWEDTARNNLTTAFAGSKAAIRLRDGPLAELGSPAVVSEGTR